MIRINLSSVEVIEKLQQASKELSDLEPLYSSIAELVVQSTKERFATGVAPDGTKWRPKVPRR